VTDEQNLDVVAVETLNLAVHLRNQRAGCVNGVETAIIGGLRDRRGDSVRAKDQARTFGNLVDLVHKNGTASFELRHNVHVVHDLLAHVNGRTKTIEGLFDGNHSAVNAGAVTTWSSE